MQPHTHEHATHNINAVATSAIDDRTQIALYIFNINNGYVISSTVSAIHIYNYLQLSHTYAHTKHTHTRDIRHT